MLYKLLQTEPDHIYFLLRLTAGVIIFPYGMQKLLGWFDDFGGGVGIKASLAQFKKKKIPLVIAWMVIIGQSFGSILLIVGLGGRIAAAGNFIIFCGALASRLPASWIMNWNGKKREEGVEYFVLLLAVLFAVVIKGSGVLSVNQWLQHIIK